MKYDLSDYAFAIMAIGLGLFFIALAIKVILL